MPDDESLAVDWRLVGRLAEYHELRAMLTERPGLTVLTGDPWSGTSAVLNAVASNLEHPHVLVDARSSGDPLDLASAIADFGIRALARGAAAWWIGGAPAPSAAGLRLARTLNAHGIDFEGVRRGNGEPSRLLSDAVDLVVALADGPVTLLVDHFGLFLRALSSSDARELLAVVRTLRQRHVDLDVVLVEHPGGMTAAALADRHHPLFRAGHQLRFTRPEPYRFADDLELVRRRITSKLRVLPAAAELAWGVPGLAWRTVELFNRGETVEERARDGWRALRTATLPSVSRAWDLLRRVHPLAQPVVAAIASGLGPHAVDANSKSVNDALVRLRDLGMVWQPAPRAWSLADPLLAAWTRDFPPSWIRHRRTSLG
ncbi:MAG TPA: hypothetical protein VF250_17210 [Conexibacter sp.]